MEQCDIDLINGAIKKYYLDAYKSDIPDDMASREFGYQQLGEDIMKRHASYADERTLRVMLVGSAPSDVYCSNSRYRFPTLSMKEKSWIDADLIFDIDAKDLALSCRKDHSVQVCECGRVSAIHDGACAACSSSKKSVYSLPCTKCTDGAYEEVTKLRGILCNDLGVDDELIRVYFSGNEGYHVYVKEFQELGSRERRELCDYVMFNGAIPDAYGITRRNTKPDIPSTKDTGWRGRLAKGVGKAKLVEHSQKGYDVYADALKSASAVIGAKIDPQVTADIHRIFRMPGSINGKSGLAKIRATPETKPYVDACLMSSEPVEVTAECPHKFSLGGKRFGPYSRDRIEVPTYAAAYMILKRMATSCVHA